MHLVNLLRCHIDFLNDVTVLPLCAQKKLHVAITRRALLVTRSRRLLRLSRALVVHPVLVVDELREGLDEVDLAGPFETTLRVRDIPQIWTALRLAVRYRGRHGAFVHLARRKAGDRLPVLQIHLTEAVRDLALDALNLVQR